MDKETRDILEAKLRDALEQEAMITKAMLRIQGARELLEKLLAEADAPVEEKAEA